MPRAGWSFRRRRALRLAMHIDQGGRCALCHMPLMLAEASIDHIKPRSRGGTDDRWNLQLTHHRCNLAKGADYFRSAS